MDLFRSVRHSAYEKAKKLYENVVPPPKQSRLQEKGMHSVTILSRAEPSAIDGLSLDAADERLQQHLPLHVQILIPREFEIAGDALVEACPTWAWESGDREMNNPYLPTGKQFLITRNVPCAERASYIESYADQLVGGENIDKIDEKEVEEEWITTSSEIDKEEKDGFQLLPQSNIASTDKAAIPTIGDEDDRFESMNESKTDDKGVIESMDDIPDISDLDIGGSIPTNTAEAPSAGNAAKDEEPPPSMADAQDKKAESSSLRTYDVIISYDMMYYVPRCWLIGYDAHGSPLTKREVMEDIIKDYRLKTVTIESHPHIKRGGAVVSIHPCQHADTMLELMKRYVMDEEGGERRDFKLEQYMILFLKFLSSVIPTIEYDFTYSI